ncbi:ABC transporter ATP-binding protein [Bradyrhizobium betae]|uniref:Branched-chain amino acid ABC transporter ATP-binding protein n=1 Tax=Bradyrhizobium betae TaxID=244734 RepID=A0A4Q1VS16_9BRAD|nr:ABC transporter ATP-binding protein [Bradyrhizobium betae]RXT54263.1 branched-chain amino acid ABC transporter ATP-binding protein [Bradyrhizobium betae]
MTAALRTKQLRKSFGALQVAKDINFSLDQGARHALIGPNGAGKSTFVNLLSGTLKPTGGKVYIGDVDVTNASPASRVNRGLARTFQINSLFNQMTVTENVALAVSARLKSDGGLWRNPVRQPELQREVDRLLDMVDLTSVATKRISEISYGQRRLVEIALALALKPSVLLLDEPAAGLPKSSSERLLELLVRLPRETAILIIDHDMDIVFGFADTVTVMFQGGILVEGKSGEIKSNALVREVYLGNARHA